MISLRIVGTDLPGETCGPHRKVEVGIQIRSEPFELQSGGAKRVEWTVEASAASGGSATAFRGPAIHGKADERFLYLTWLSEGQMFRRAKLQLDAVPDALVAKAIAKGKPLTAELSLTDGRGLPVCASVRPPLIRWSV